MKVAVIQMSSGSKKTENIAKAVSLVAQAIKNGGQFILLPEVFNYRGLIKTPDDLRSIKEKIPGGSTQPFIDLAKRHGVAILAGSIYEEIKNSEKVYNTSVFINNAGEIKAAYRKMHLFDALVGKIPVKESPIFDAGHQPAAVVVENFLVGLSVCYDLRFAELYQRYAKDGAQVFTVPSAFTRITGQAHWEVLLRARAIENLCYVLAPNQIGLDGRGVESYGRSMIIDPWGEILSVASADREEIIYADIDINVVLEKRKILPGIYKK